jgi:hypothetical protein
MTARAFIGLLCIVVHSSLPIYFQTGRNIKFVYVRVGSLYVFGYSQLRWDSTGMRGTTH